MLLSQQLAEYVSACFTGLWIQSHEHEDALTEIAQLCRQEEWRLAVWDIEQGLQIPGGANETTNEAENALAGIKREIGGAAVGRCIQVVFTRVAIAHIAQADNPGHVLQFAVTVGRAGEACRLAF